MNLTRLMDLHNRAKEKAQAYPKRRFLYSDLVRGLGKHFTGVIGPRGVGKSVLLRQFALERPDAFYLSADTLEPDDDAWEVLVSLKKHYGFRTFLLDEIHFLPDANAFLKRTYDFLDIRIIFSSSVALAKHASAHDLSRRVRLRSLRPFSYREYMAFQENLMLPPIPFETLLRGGWSPAHLRSGHRFDAYLRGGLLPYALEEPEPLVLLESIVEKIIVRDLPSVARLGVHELDIIRRLLRFVGRSGIDGINNSSLSRNVGITKYKAAQYVDLLVKAFVLQAVLPAGTNVLREPKVLMAPPHRLLYRSFNDAIGGLREDFAVEAFIQAGLRFQYLKSTRGAKTPDFLIDTDGETLAVEIGGRGKGRRQFKGIAVDRKVIFAHTDLPDEKRIPLFLLGYVG